jgi:hypothetical protein
MDVLTGLALAWLLGLTLFLTRRKFYPAGWRGIALDLMTLAAFVQLGITSALPFEIAFTIGVVCFIVYGGALVAIGKRNI